MSKWTFQLVPAHPDFLYYHGRGKYNDVADYYAAQHDDFVPTPLRTILDLYCDLIERPGAVTPGQVHLVSRYIERNKLYERYHDEISLINRWFWTDLQKHVEEGDFSFMNGEDAAARWMRSAIENHVNLLCREARCGS